MLVKKLPKLHPVKSFAESKRKSKILFNRVNWEKLNGLIPVVTQDYKTNKVLMLGFMNKEALKKTLKEGKVTYFSRVKKNSGQKEKHRAIFN